MNSNRALNVAVCAAFFLVGWSACKSDQNDNPDILTSEADIKRGEDTFMQDCSACHNFKYDAIGPQLGGITSEVSVDYLRGMIKSAQTAIESGDERAEQLFDKYKVYMPSFAMYSDERIDQIIAFINTKPAPVKADMEDDTLQKLANPIAEIVEVSDLVVDLQYITQIPYSSDEMPRTRIVKMDYIRGSDRLFILDLRGKMYELIDDQPLLYFNMQEARPDFIHKPGLATGFGSFAFHPEFLRNGILYTTHTEPPATASADFSYADSIDVTLQWVLTEWSTNDPLAGTLKAEGREMLRVNMASGIHGVQEISFNPNSGSGDEDYGLLYVGIGDGGSVGMGFPEVALGPSQIWGSIIRIDPQGENSDNGQYGIPSDNPFANDGDPGTLAEVYAHGFRNPHRISWDSNNRLLATCIGQHRVEELNLIEPGNDYGWPLVEGTFLILPKLSMSDVYELESDADWVQDLTFPVMQFDHDEGNAISGGFEYRGSNLPQLSGKYLFGDIVRGRLFYVNLSELELGKQAPLLEWRISMDGQLTDLMTLCGNARVDLRFAQDGQGEMYIFTKADGKVYKMVSMPTL